jgi:hypothetical protein
MCQTPGEKKTNGFLARQLWDAIEGSWYALFFAKRPRTPLSFAWGKEHPTAWIFCFAQTPEERELTSFIEASPLKAPRESKDLLESAVANILSAS